MSDLTDEKSDTFEIFASAHGGFIVRPAITCMTGMYNRPSFAATTIEEALTYIRVRLAPSRAKKAGEG